MVTGIILASGFSKRMGDEKLLLEVDGVPMVERVIKTAQSSLIDEIILIYRQGAIKMRANQYGIKTVLNLHAEKGQSESVKLGIVQASSNSDGYMFLVGDQPYLSHTTVNRLIEVFNRNRDYIIMPEYNGARGNPVIFPAALKSDLLSLQGDCGGRAVAERMGNMVKLVPIESGIEGADIDTREVYETMQNK